MATFANIAEYNLLGTGAPLPDTIISDSATALTVKRTTKDLVFSGTGTGDIRVYGTHAHTVSKNYRVVIDTAGDETTATFKWSFDAGVTFAEQLVPVSYLARYMLWGQNSILFAYGQYNLNDQWDFIAIQLSSQLADLEVDTTNSKVKIGARIDFGDTLFYSNLLSAGNPQHVFDDVGGGITSRFLYSRAARTMTWADRGTVLVTLQGAAAAVDRYASFPVPLRLSDISTPATPTTSHASFYNKLVSSVARPHWLDHNGLEQEILPLSTKGDLYVFTTKSVRLPVGADDTILRANGASTEGLHWTDSLTALQITTATIVTVKGGASAGLNLTLVSTSHATKGKILFGTSAYDEVNNRLGVGTAAPDTTLHVAGTTTLAGNVIMSGGSTIHPGTADAADNSFVAIAGGGPTVSHVRGGYAVFYGNESAGTGKINITAGNVAGSDIILSTNNVERFRVTQDAKLAFFAVTAVVQQTSGANLTNNVTSGGTDDTVDNWTNLTVYATDAAAIRNAAYQLARKVKQVNDALRAYGLLT